jgi:DNA-binding transcriptional MerR regulator
MDDRIEKVKELRSQGMSLRDIEKIVKAARSSISRWSKNVKLTDEQKKALKNRNPAFNAEARRPELQVEKYRKLREGYQESGRVLAKQMNVLHASGCMLYWAEGAKNKNSVKLSNTDVNLLKFFLKFLRKCYGVSDKDVKIRINCYTDKGKTVKEIEEFWIAQLCLPKTCLGKTLENYDTRGKGATKRNKRIWGICEIAVCKTEIVQSIFGAIQEYSGFDNPEWLNILPGKYAGIV